MRDFLKVFLPIVSIIGSLDSVVRRIINMDFLTSQKDSDTVGLQIIYWVILLLLASVIYFVYNAIINNVKVISKDSKLNLKIKYGDLFKNSKAIKVIPIDSGLTVDVDRKVHKKSVHYQFMKKKCCKIDELNVCRQDSQRICSIADNRYYLLKVGTFDENNKVRLENYLEYFKMVYDLCEFIDNHAKGEEVVLSNIGTNIRIGDDKLDKMERLTLLKTIIESYNFTQDVNITILLRREFDKINKYKLSKI